MRGCNRRQIVHLAFPRGDFLRDVVLDKNRGSKRHPEMLFPFYDNGYVNSLENGYSLSQATGEAGLS